MRPALPPGARFRPMSATRSRARTSVRNARRRHEKTQRQAERLTGREGGEQKKRKKRKKKKKKTKREHRVSLQPEVPRSNRAQQRSESEAKVAQSVPRQSSA